MSGMVVVPLYALALFYAVFMLRMARGWRRVVRQHTSAGRPPSLVSVIVAARNEAASIGACLQRIMTNRYPQFEVVIVDDFSADATAEIVERCARSYDEGRVRLIRLEDRLKSNEAGKTGAIEMGVAEAKGEVVLTTDADCLVGPEWIATMMATMPEEVAFVSGPVLFEPGASWHGRLQSLEFLGLIAVGAGGIGSGLPSMCNSANIAYRRETFGRLVGSQPLTGAPSDEVMLQLLHRERPGSVAFCASPAAVVRTQPAGTLKSFIRQRRRWAGNGARYPSRSLLSAIAAIYAFYCVLFASIIALPLFPALFTHVVFILAVKVAVEAALLVPAARHFGMARLLRWLIPGQLLQIPYVVVIGLAGIVGNVDWKDRRAH